MSGKVDVIIPVYNGLDVLKGCLESLWAARCNTPCELIVIDDASPDPSVRGYLNQCAKAGRINLLINERNLGFVGTVNRGMALHPDRDVLLLNSDTVVYGDWLDRLVAAANREPRIATSNPMTNVNGSHISYYPVYAPGGWRDIEVDDATLDAIAAEVNTGNCVHTHATVGFCMFIKRACLDDIGLFDIEHFPVAYGEETDFCFRAVKMGWRHVVTGDTFVTHLEGKSFGEKKQRLMQEMFDRFQLLHPEAVGRDRQFTATDPIRPLRAALDLGRLRHLLGGRHMLRACFADNAGQDDVKDVLALRYDPAARTLALHPADAEAFPNLRPFFIPQQIDMLNEALGLLGISAIEVSTEEDLTALRRNLAGLPFEVGLVATLSVAAASTSAQTPEARSGSVAISRVAGPRYRSRLARLLTGR